MSDSKTNQQPTVTSIITILSVVAAIASISGIIYFDDRGYTKGVRDSEVKLTIKENKLYEAENAFKKDVEAFLKNNADSFNITFQESSSLNLQMDSLKSIIEQLKNTIAELERKDYKPDESEPIKPVSRIVSLSKEVPASFKYYSYYHKGVRNGDVYFSNYISPNGKSALIEIRPDWQEGDLNVHRNRVAITNLRISGKAVKVWNHRKVPEGTNYIGLNVALKNPNGILKEKGSISFDISYISSPLILKLPDLKKIRTVQILYNVE